MANEQQKELILIPIDSIRKEFKEHLDIEDNYKILMSGKFGSGKTTFLNDFFIKDDRFDVVKLYPVHYSVAQNEDIFELIKFDILFELLAIKDISFDQEEFDNWLTSQVFIQENVINILKPIIENTSKIGKSVATIASELYKLYESYLQRHKEFNRNEEKDVLSYLNSYRNKLSTIHEEDHITNIISNALLKLPKQTVLIIDDLDRIDPEHIFRILNVFSVHMHDDSNQNKFGFDKIVLVGDVDNIRMIFHSKYGTDVDFSGYIDKFYSKSIFKYDNSQSITKYVEHFISTVTLVDNASVLEWTNYENETASLLRQIMYELVKNKLISLRKLKQLERTRFLLSYNEDDNYKGGTIYFTIKQYPVIAVVLFLNKIFDSISSLKSAISQLNSIENSVDTNKYEPILFPFIKIRQHQNNFNHGEEYFIDQNPASQAKYTLDRRLNGQVFANKINGAVDKSIAMFLRTIELAEYFGIIR